MLEFRHARQNIVHNVQIFVKIIQVGGPIGVSRRKDFNHTPQVTKLNLNPFPSKISYSLLTMWRKEENVKYVQTENKKGLNLKNKMTKRLN